MSEDSHEFEEDVISRLSRVESTQTEIKNHIQAQYERIKELEEVQQSKRSQEQEGWDISHLQEDVQGLMDIVNTVQRYWNWAVYIIGIVALSALIEIVKTVVELGVF